MNSHTLSSDVRVLERAVEWGSYRSLWLCTVLHTWGSSPRSPGALFVVNDCGEWEGSLSGGCVEQSFLKQIAEGQWQQPSQVVCYGAGGLEPDITLPCGGKLDILVEYLSPSPLTTTYLSRLLDALQHHQYLRKSLRLPEPCHELVNETDTGHNHIVWNAPEITIWHGAAPRLVVAGYSNVARYCIEFAVMLGFDVILCEPRTEFLQQIEREPQLPVTLFKCLPALYLEKEGCHARTAVVALTHDARMDDLTLMEAIETPAFYIGVMGSENNSARRRERLKEIAGFNEEQLARIHAPIGLSIGSKTPAEIAIAVMTDIVASKNGINVPVAHPSQ